MLNDSPRSAVAYARIMGAVAASTAGFVASAQSAECHVAEASIYRSGVAVHSWSHAGHQLIVCSYGSTPTKVDDQTWQASEFFVVYRSRNRSTVLFDFDATTDARYSAAPPSFIFTELTVAAEDHPWTARLPLVRHDVRLGMPLPSAVRTSFVFSGRPFRMTSFVELVRQLNEPSISSPDRERVLYRIRDVGVSNPTVALEHLHRAEGAPWADGDLGETLSAVIREVELARDLPHRTPF